MPRLQCSVVGVTKGLQNVCVISPLDSNFLLQPTRGCKAEIKSVLIILVLGYYWPGVPIIAAPWHFSIIMESVTAETPVP